jgi:hypothetical protein
MRSIGLLCGLAAVASLLAPAKADTTVFVNSSSSVAVDGTIPTGWALNSFDDNGNIVTSGPFLGTTGFVTGPGTPPLGTGSAQLFTEPAGPDPDPSNPGAGGAAAIATDQFDGTSLSSITALSFSAYMKSNGPVNNQQFPYLIVTIDTGGLDTSGNGNTNQIDTLTFEPPYQTPATGNGALPLNQAADPQTWQTWNAYIGGYWDGDMYVTTGYGGFDDVDSLAEFEAIYPDATIAYGGYAGLGGIALQTGFADSTSDFDGYVNFFTIGIGTDTTTFEFGTSATTPLPASLWGGSALFAAMGIAMLIGKRRAAAI